MNTSRLQRVLVAALVAIGLGEGEPPVWSLGN